MRERRSGAIVNITSITGRIAAIAQSPYVASKYAFEGLSEGLAQELAPFGIRVVIIEPGVTKSAIFAKNIDAPNTTGAYDAPYRRMFQFYAAGIANATDPFEVAEVIHEAITTDTPKLRYAMSWGGDRARSRAAPRSTTPTGSPSARSRTTPSTTPGSRPTSASTSPPPLTRVLPADRVPPAGMPRTWHSGQRTALARVVPTSAVERPVAPPEVVGRPRRREQLDGQQRLGAQEPDDLGGQRDRSRQGVGPPVGEARLGPLAARRRAGRPWSARSASGHSRPASSTGSAPVSGPRTTTSDAVAGGAVEVGRTHPRVGPQLAHAGVGHVRCGRPGGRRSIGAAR